MKVWIFVVFGLWSLTAQAAGGGVRETGNGGDTIKIRVQAVKRWLGYCGGNASVGFFDKNLYGMRSTLWYYLVADSVGLKTLPESREKTLLENLVVRGLAEDILTCPIRFADYGCSDSKGVLHAASSEPNQRGGMICVDARMIAESRTSWEDLAGLMMHEYVHHFGLKDEDHILAEYVSRSMSFLKWIIEPEGICDKGVHVHHAGHAGAHDYCDDTLDVRF